VVVALQALGLRQRPLEVVVGDLCRDVEQRAVHRRGRDALVVGGVLGIEGVRAVQADPRDPLAGRRGGHFRARWFVVEEIPMNRRAHMTQCRAGAAGHDRRQPAPLARQDRATDRIHAAVRHPKAPPSDPPVHRGPSDSQREQLRARHHPPLAPRHPNHHRPGASATSTDTMSANAAHPPRIPAHPPHGTPRTQQNTARAHTPRCPGRNPPPDATRTTPKAKTRKKCRRGRVQSPPPAGRRRQDDVKCTRPALRAARTTGRWPRRRSRRGPRTARRPCRSRA
jgi:hypothetical protein